MKALCFVLLLSGSLVLGQDSSTVPNKDAKGQVTLQGCVSRMSGDYVLMKQNPAVTYELQATGKTRLKNYLGQRVEVTGDETPTMSSSSDALNKTGSAAPTTIVIRSIKTLEKDCPVR